MLGCATNLKSIGIGLTVYATEDHTGDYPVNDMNVWAGPISVWAGAGATGAAHPDKDSYMHMFSDVILGGDRTIIWCLLDTYVYNPLNENALPGLEHPDWPLFWYDERFGYEKFMMGYKRYANMAAPGAWANSGNTDLTGPPTSPGSAQDAILADVINSNGPTAGGQFHQDRHMENFNAATPRERRENNVCYSDGHVVTHGGAPFIDGAGYLVWQGAHWVQQGPWRLMY